METQKQIHCIASNSYGTTGTHQNLLQDLSKSITILEKIIYGTKHSNRDMWWLVIRQAKWCYCFLFLKGSQNALL